MVIESDVPPKAIGTHSLKIGDATALYQAVDGLAILQRYGRWKTSASQGYLGETGSRVKDLAGRMVSIS